MLWHNQVQYQQEDRKIAFDYYGLDNLHSVNLYGIPDNSHSWWAPVHTL